MKTTIAIVSVLLGIASAHAAAQGSGGVGPNGAPAKPAAKAAPASGADAAIDKAIEDFKKVDRANLANLVESAKSAMDGIEIDSLTVPQIERLTKAGITTLAPVATREKVGNRVEAVAAAKTADGAVAATMRYLFVPRPNGRVSQEMMSEHMNKVMGLAIEATKHPALADAFKAGRGEWIFASLNGPDPNELKDAGVYDRLLPLVRESLPASFAAPVLSLYEVLTDENRTILDAKGKESLRKTVLALADKAIADPKVEDQEKEYVKYAKGLMTGAAARGELIGHAAPPLHVLWSTAKPPLESFADLKGKVVIVDFFATWCGPCVATFPHLRELKEEYKDSPLVILSVTSPQGFMVYPKATDPKEKRVDTKDRKDEIARMPAWVKDMDMTWTVAMSEENCFNPDFGVRGIPHVALIDAKGVVRVNGISPRSNELTQKVDELLREAGATPPAHGNSNKSKPPSK